MDTQPRHSPQGPAVLLRPGRHEHQAELLTSMETAPRTGTCTPACHKGTTATNPAPWGNYTSASVKLTCNSCHGDATNVGGSGAGYGLSAPASYGHNPHLTLGGSSSEFAAPGTGGIKIFVNGTTVRLQNSVDVSSNQALPTPSARPAIRTTGARAARRPSSGVLMEGCLTGASRH